MKYDQTIITPKGLTVHIRNGVASDGSTVLENFNLTHAETDYLLSYPDENHFDSEQESRYLERKAASPNEIELIAFVNGKVAGTAGIDAIGAQYKVAHRAEFGVSILKDYWGLGIGRALMEACIQCARNAGYAQLELDVVAENTRALFLYQMAGFVEYGRNPQRLSLSERWISRADLHAAGIVNLIINQDARRSDAVQPTVPSLKSPTGAFIVPLRSTNANCAINFSKIYVQSYNFEKFCRQVK